MASTEETIVAKIVDILETDPTLTDLKTVNSDKIQIAISDFRNHEVPAVQIWDLAQTLQHERSRIKKSWALSLEIVMKSLTSGKVDQNALWDLRRRIELALWSRPNLGIPAVVHMVYTGNITDLHSVEPFYIARIDLEVMFYDDLTGSC